MKYLTAPAIGSGTDADPIRPDLPDGTSFVGQHGPKSGTYIVAVPDGVTVAAKAGRMALTTARAKSDEIDARSLRASDVDTWRVG